MPSQSPYLFPTPDKPSLSSACARTVLPLFYVAFPAKLITDLSQFGGPIFLQAILDFTSRNTASVSDLTAASPSPSPPNSTHSEPYEQLYLADHFDSNEAAGAVRMVDGMGRSLARALL